jgi:pyruvate,water dikinase
MAPGRYEGLTGVYEKISNELVEVIDSTPRYEDGPLLLDAHSVQRKDRQHVGDKMANLGEAASIPGITVPRGFIVTASATRRFLTRQLRTEINRLLQMLDLDDLADLYRICDRLQDLIASAPMPPEVEELIFSYYDRLEAATYKNCRVALRSSALGEDAAGISFAGLYRTILDVDRASLIDGYRQVVASKYGARAIAYRRRRGFRHEDVEMCVGCLAMVPALVSGVTYSGDPGGRDNDVIRINATAGFGKGVVDGTRLVDLYLVGRDRPHPVLYSDLRSNRGQKPEQKAAEGALSYSQVRQLAEAALLLERHFAAPQDIEWSFDHHGTLMILQSRPITVKKSRAEDQHAPKQAGGEVGVQPFFLGGITASIGTASGTVHIVDADHPVEDFKKNSILVLEYPLPDYATLVGQAAAVIAEHGSEAGHLATVAREFAVPALFGVDRARHILQQGVKITINAASRAIYEGCREDILKQGPVRKDPMAGSPVQRLLTEALQYITPLNLNDPGSSRFKPSWCETLHDITRFCHEQSVAEMLNFNRRVTYDNQAAKSLTGGVPLQWSVINLADGFQPNFDATSPTVDLADIVSQPMLAICRGLSAVPWEGPPPVSARGFGAIIFQSAMRPDLDPAVASPLAANNYFMISRHFCNVSVRLGYHYAMIEAYVGDLLTENYITFRFKGGAADIRRKAVRAKLLAEVLESYEFRIDLRSDSLLARVKKRPAAFLEERLTILGYLILHVRQLDMVMNQPQAVDRYRQQFLSDIEAVLKIKKKGGEMI